MLKRKMICDYNDNEINEIIALYESGISLTSISKKLNIVRKKLIEVKSLYTYDVLLGIKKNRWTKKYDYLQLKKIEWVNKNILPLEIVIMEKNNIKEIKQL